MLPVCVATPRGCCPSSSFSQISFHVAWRPTSSLFGSMKAGNVFVDSGSFGISIGFHLREVSFKTKASNFLYTPIPNKFDNSKFSFSNEMVDESKNAVSSYLEISSIPLPTESSRLMSKHAISETVAVMDSTIDFVSESSTSPSGPLSVSADALTNLKSNVEESLSRVFNSIDASYDKGKHVVTNLVDYVDSSLTSASKSISDGVNNALGGIFSTVMHTEELAKTGLTDFSGDLKEASSKIGTSSIDTLRWGIVTLERYLATGSSFVVYYYWFAKDYLPPEARDALSLIEDRATEILRPVGYALKQVYSAIEVLETYIGINPTNSIVPFIILIGTTVILGISYRLLTYGGYSGDLSPESALELLKGKETGVLIDIRPENIRERDGIPDLRREARYKYASVTLPKVDDSIRNLIKNERSLEDALVATVIRNLKVVGDRSKVIVLDADGTHSKVIARSLRKLGVKEPYLVLGGFRSWATDGLRIKELKPETTLTVLNEEAEEILGDIKSDPLQIAGFGVASIAAIYALLEWEKSLQLIGVIGLGQTIYRRVATYENSEDFKKDVRLFLVPIEYGAQAFTWVAAKLEPTKIGLQTTPSSSAVQDRVLQAAAKHESQPSDTEDTQDLSQEILTPVSENEDPSDAYSSINLVNWKTCLLCKNL